MKQLLSEAVEETEKYGSLFSTYLILKKCNAEYDSLVKETEANYSFSVDDIILISLSYKELNKTQFFVISFLICDYLSSRYITQDCLFYFRWDKRIFIYSPRTEAHLLYLIKTGYAEGYKYFKLTEKGKVEAEAKKSLLSTMEKIKIDDMISCVLSKNRLSELKKYVRSYIFGK
ncbi:hypothetical protein [Acidianus sp. HS-5]|uniref:hypothetical protein n=1 Tax=Acidianus sp. HS-5 TaxID=2886040 RepID=UPI001F453ED0|nr:hypothetical protein [Acidianus sp. HS-5]